MEASAGSPDGGVIELSLLEQYRANLPVTLAPEFRDRVVICASFKLKILIPFLTRVLFIFQ